MGPLHRPRIHLIATQASPIGRRAGQWKRNPGAAQTMARDAAVIPDVHRLLRHLHLMIARPDLPIGPPVGLSRKRPGVAPMPGRAAPRRLAAAPDRQSIIVGVYAGALAQAPSSGAPACTCRHCSSVWTGELVVRALAFAPSSGGRS